MNRAGFMERCASCTVEHIWLKALLSLSWNFSSFLNKDPHFSFMLGCGNDGAHSAKGEGTGQWHDPGKCGQRWDRVDVKGNGENFWGTDQLKTGKYLCICMCVFMCHQNQWLVGLGRAEWSDGSFWKAGDCIWVVEHLLNPGLVRYSTQTTPVKSGFAGMQPHVFC